MPTKTEQFEYKLEVQTQQEKQHDSCSGAKKCNHIPSDEIRSCPYSEELYNDYTPKCVCCSCCSSECVWSI